MAVCNALQAVGVIEGEAAQCILALQEIRASARRNHALALTQGMMNLGDAAVVRVTQGPDRRDHIEAKFMLGQRQASFLFGPIRFVKLRTRWVRAASDMKSESHNGRQGGAGTIVVIRKAT